MKKILLKLLPFVTVTIFLILIGIITKSPISAHKILIDGNEVVSNEEIKAIAHFYDKGQGEKGYLPFLEANIESHPFIKTAIVKRTSLEEISISITERAPMAKVIAPGLTTLVDNEGYILKDYTEDTSFVFSVLMNYPLINNGIKAEDAFLEGLLENLYTLQKMDEINVVDLTKENGIFITLKGLKTVFIFGKRIPSVDNLKRLFNISKSLKEQDLNLKYINMTSEKENPIGFS